MMRKFFPLRHQRQSRVHSFLSSFSTHVMTVVATTIKIPPKFAWNTRSITTLSPDFDFIPQATTLLKKMLSSNDHSAMKSFALSDEMKLRIYDELSQSNRKLLSISDLLLALFAFAHGPKDGKQYRLIEIIEIGIAPLVSEAKIGDVLSLLTTYCFSCRKHPDIMRSINSVITEHVEVLSRSDLHKLLWANARLNNRVEYNKRAGCRALSYPDNPVKIGNHAFSNLVRSLWSLAVLEELTFAGYKSVEPLLLSMTVKREGNHDIYIVSPKAAQQLSQILLELQTVATRELNENPLSEEKLRNLEDIKTTQLWALERAAAATATAASPHSSFSHKELSRNLRVLGIANKNEVTISGTYVVDILLNASYRGPSSCKGTVIELDGPSHYEHYQLAPLGPTVMKRRHLEAAGYSVLTLPYWKWGFCDTEGKKHKILGDLLGVL